jgi:hypothetical protein
MLTFSFWAKTGSVVKNKTLRLQLITALSDGDPISQELSIKHDVWSLIKNSQLIKITDNPE